MKTATGVDYAWFLGALGEVTPLCETSDVRLRHDVDNILSVAMDMARVEASLGVRSTYFLLTPPWMGENYLGSWFSLTDASGTVVEAAFRLSDDGAAAIRELRSLGHEVGYHNNLVTVSRQSGMAPERLLRAVLSAFADEGITNPGCASHGDAEARDGAYVNYDFLADRDLASLGLAYEAYWLPRRGYLSDSGGNLNGKPNPTQADFADAIASLEKPAQVLMHPCWWRF